jgi:hypothetical protein
MRDLEHLHTNCLIPAAAVLARRKPAAMIGFTGGRAKCVIRNFWQFRRPSRKLGRSPIPLKEFPEKLLHPRVFGPYGYKNL